MKDSLELLRAATAEIEDRDPKLAEELKSVRARAAETMRESGGLEAMGGEGAADLTGLETIVLRTGRPVLAITDNQPQLVFQDTDSEVWKDRLIKARDGINHAIRAVGRIELDNNPRFDWVGTGWLVANDVVVTNRHVASEFARADGKGFTFRRGSLGQMTASIDFLQEIKSNRTDVFDIKEVIHIESDTGPDISFLRVKPRDGRNLATPIALSTSAPTAKQQVAVIGYPAKDSRVPEVDLMERIFGNVYNKKRLAPGQLIGLGANEIQHDCSTLGGNSGSVVLSLDSGEAVGLHFSGRFLEANFAVPASVVASRLSAVGRRGSGVAVSVPSVQPAREQSPQITQQPTAVTFQVPLTISIQLGPVSTPAAVVVTPGPATAPVVTPPEPDEDDTDEVFEEGRVEDYSDKDGYQSDFLGSDFEVPMPRVVKARKDILPLNDTDGEESVLNYAHYSVIMSASRRMCFLSAVNINGKKSRKTTRGPWKIDPRIDKGAQIMKECYGNPPKFSRGHMTRREDPAWGTENQADEGNLDSMHVTNTVPQMQPFNAGIWLGLEDYALQHARKDKMSICVFTGPFFAKNDPIMYGVKIPISFWKVIAFIHDDTGALSATGYTMSQRKFLELEEFVFSQHETTQTSIRDIEQRAGLDFGELSKVDPFRRATESFAAPLTDPSQIKFL
jgi:endonuclease G, mitochondrial